jgi:hypothetical protein
MPRLAASMAAGLEAMVAARRNDAAQQRVEIPVRALGESEAGMRPRAGFQTQR